MPRDLSSLARQGNEHGLSHILGELRIVHLPACGGIHQSDVPMHQRGKGGFRAGACVFLKQGGAVHPHHSLINARRKQKGTKFLNSSCAISSTSVGQTTESVPKIVDLLFFGHEDSFAFARSIENQFIANE
jgi:hypothetical protein